MFVRHDFKIGGEHVGRGYDCLRKELESQRHNKLAQPKVRLAVNVLDFNSGGARFEPRSGLAYTHTCFHGFIHFLQANVWRLSRVAHKRCLTNDFQFINIVTC
jgi:hypothetical protein